MATIEGVTITEDQTEVNLSNKNLTEFPAQLLTLTNIESLNLSNNSITSIPSNITIMSKLASLDLSYNQITTIPASMANMESQMDNFNISHNPLISIDSSLTRLLLTNIFNPRIYYEHPIAVTNPPGGVTAKVYYCYGV